MKFNNNLFELESEQIETSKMMYSGKIIKCLVAPYHSYMALENDIPYTKSTFLFPEREMSAQQVRGFISMIVNSPIQDEIRIITADQTIIGDMVGGCVRVLTEYDTIVDTDAKTFMANIHDIRYGLLQNPKHQKTQAEKELSKDKIRKIIEKVESGTMNQSEIDEARNHIKIIGEPIIERRLGEMLDEIQRSIPHTMKSQLFSKLESGSMSMNDFREVIEYTKTTTNINELEKILKLLQTCKYTD